MTAKVILQDAISNRVVFSIDGDITILSIGLNANTIIEAMKAYAEQEREKAFNEAREKKDSYWHGADQYIRVDKYEDTEEYKKQNPLI